MKNKLVPVAPKSQSGLFTVVIASLLLAEVLAFLSCKKEAFNDGVQMVIRDSAQYNRAPIANAGDDQTISMVTVGCTLNGTNSYDPDGTILAYQWTKIAGPPIRDLAFSTYRQAYAHFLAEGKYQFELRVTDNGGLSAKDTVQITVNAALVDINCDNTSRPQVDARLISVGQLSEPRLGTATAFVGNKILFAGAEVSGSAPFYDYGSSRVDIYDITTQTWSTASLSKPRMNIAAVTAGTKAFFAGGRLGDGANDQLFSTVDIYDASNNTWSVASLSEPRAYVAAATVGNKVFFAGGEKNFNYDCSDRVDIYDVELNTWSTRQLSTPRSGMSAVTVGQKVYFAGGTSENRWYSPSAQIDIYDNTTKTWSTSTLSEPMGFLAGVAAADKIYWTSHCKVEIKDINTQNSSFASLFKSASQSGAEWYGGWTIVNGQNAVLKDNKIVFLHTRDGKDANTNKFDIYDVATQAWSIGVLPQKVAGASIVSANNAVYLHNGSEVWQLEF